MRAVIGRSVATGAVAAPPSKSMAHRYIICAALSGEGCRVSNLSMSEDIRATIDCIQAMGATVEKGEDWVFITPGTSATQGITTFPCRESGSTMRFFMGIAMTLGIPATFRGSDTLRKRPMSVYEDICSDQNVIFKKREEDIYIDGRIEAGIYNIPGDISSQFITGLLYGLPLLAGDSEIRLIPPVESRSYINLTIEALGEFGVTVEWKDEHTLLIPGNQNYKACDIEVEGDYSNAAFLEAFNTLGGNVTVKGLKKNSLQGDKVYEELYDRLLSGTPEIDLSDCPDLGPVLFAVAAANQGASFIGTRRLQIKESNRGRVMCEELAKLGINTDYSDDRIVIYGGGLKTPDIAIDSHNDHRIAMSMALLLTLTGGVIEDAEAVNKSYPDFYDDIRSLGIEVRNE